MDLDMSSKEAKLGLNLWARLTRTYHQQLKQSSQFLMKWNMSIAQYEALVQIGRNRRMSQKELADKLFVTKGNVTQLLRKMEDSGYVSREKQWKTKYLSLTDKGVHLYETVVPDYEAFLAARFQNLTKKEKKQFLKLLKKMSSEVSAHED